MEDIAHGERILAYVVEALAEGGVWRELCAGESVGHKRIHQLDNVRTPHLRLRVTDSKATPHIRKLKDAESLQS